MLTIEDICDKILQYHSTHNLLFFTDVVNAERWLKANKDFFGKDLFIRISEDIRNNVRWGRTTDYRLYALPKQVINLLIIDKKTDLHRYVTGTWFFMDQPIDPQYLNYSCCIDGQKSTRQFLVNF